MSSRHLYEVKLDKCSSSSCELIDADFAFAAYSIMSLSPSGCHLVMGNLSGSMKLLPIPYHGMSFVCLSVCIYEVCSVCLSVYVSVCLCVLV